MRLNRKLGFVAGVAGTALAVVYYAVLAPAVVNKERVMEGLAGGLRGALGLSLSYRDVSFKVWPRPGVLLKEVVIKNEGQKEIARADEMRIGLSYPGFIALRPKVALIALTRPRMDLAAGDVSFREGEGVMPFRGKIRFREGFVRYAAERRTLFLDGVDGDLKCRAAWGRELELRGKVRAAKINLSGVKEDGAGGIAVAAEGRVLYAKEKDGGRITLDGVDFLLDRARLRTQGWLQTGPGEKSLDLTLRGKDMELKHVLPALASRFSEAELEGVFDVEVSARGRYDGGRKPEIRGTLSLSRGRIKPEEGDGVAGLEAKVRFENDQYIIENVTCQSKYGPFKARGRIVADDRWRTKVSAEGVVPLEVLALVVGIRPEYGIRGPAGFDADLDTELADPGRTTLDGTITLKGCSLRLKPFAQPFRDLRGTVYCDGYKLKAGRLAGALGSGSFELGGSWEGFQTPRIEFAAVSDDIDIDAALPPRGQPPKKKTGAEGAAAGLPGRDPVIRGGVRFKKCKVLSMQTKDFEADCEYGGGVLNLTRFAFAAYDGKVTGMMTVYPRRPANYTCSATVRNARVGVFLTENKYLENVVTGSFSADVVFSARGTSYDEVKATFGGKGSLELTGGRVAKLPLLVELAKWSRIDYFEPLQVSKLWVMAEAREGRIATKDLRIENGDMVITAEGEVGLDKTLNFKVATSFEKKAADRLAREAKALALVRDAEGRGHFNFVVTGDATKPAFQLDSKSMLGTNVGGAPPGSESPAGEIGEIF